MEHTFVRHETTKALLNTDNESLKIFKANRDKYKKDQELFDRVTILESQVLELTNKIKLLTGE